MDGRLGRLQVHERVRRAGPTATPAAPTPVCALASTPTTCTTAATQFEEGKVVRPGVARPADVPSRADGLGQAQHLEHEPHPGGHRRAVRSVCAATPQRSTRCFPSDGRFSCWSNWPQDDSGNLPPSSNFSLRVSISELLLRRSLRPPAHPQWPTPPPPPPPPPHIHR